MTTLAVSSSNQIAPIIATSSEPSVVGAVAPAAAVDQSNAANGGSSAPHASSSPVPEAPIDEAKQQRLVAERDALLARVTAMRKQLAERRAAQLMSAMDGWMESKFEVEVNRKQSIRR